MQNLRTWRTGVPGGGVSWNVYIIPHFAANVKIQYPNKVIRIRGKSCVWNRNATFRSAAYQKSRCTAAFFKGRAYAYGRRQKRHLSIGKAAGARKKAHPGERVGFCGITDLRTDRSGASRRGPSRTAQSYTSAYRSVRGFPTRAFAYSSIIHFCVQIGQTPCVTGLCMQLKQRLRGGSAKKSPPGGTGGLLWNYASAYRSVRRLASRAYA